MNYAIQYHEISGDWLIFDISDGFELVGIHSTEKEAKRHATQLEHSRNAPMDQRCNDQHSLYVVPNENTWLYWAARVSMKKI